MSHVDPDRPDDHHTMPLDDQMAAFVGPLAAGTDGPIVMLNLNRYREVAVYADGRDAGERSGRAVYLDYGVVAQAGLDRVGGKVLWATDSSAPLIGCDHDTFDEVLAVWYPSRQAFIELTSDPAYQEALAHREAALETSALIPCVGEADPVLRTPF